MHSIVRTFRGAVIKVEVANFCAAMDTLIDQDVSRLPCQQIHQTPKCHILRKFCNTNLPDIYYAYRITQIVMWSAVCEFRPIYPPPP